MLLMYWDFVWPQKKVSSYPPEMVKSSKQWSTLSKDIAMSIDFWYFL